MGGGILGQVVGVVCENRLVKVFLTAGETDWCRTLFSEGLGGARLLSCAKVERGR